MIHTALKSPKESIGLIAASFRSALAASGPEPAQPEEMLLSVREDVAFGDNWLNLGRVALKPDRTVDTQEGNSKLENCVRFGFYEWKMDKYENLHSGCMNIMFSNAERDKPHDQRYSDKARRALQSVLDVSRRMGLLFPYFDASVFSSMPFRRPTTVVVDTSAIGQGGVDFLINFLCPMARLKIPAVVHMEILNQSDRYFSLRRKSNVASAPKSGNKTDILLEHVISQGNQRALLRFELHSDAEIERTSLLSDPLRNAFQSDKESARDWPELNLSTPIRSYCDRLILETTRQHMSTVAPGHPVMLMTGDEGLARMALADGIEPLFLQSNRLPEMYGQTLTGLRFHPFSGELLSIPLQNLIWELAVTFGNARLSSIDGTRKFEVCAIARDLSWQPFHAKDDLLRIKWDGIILEGAQPQGNSLSAETAEVLPTQQNISSQSRQRTERIQPTQSDSPIPSQRSASRLALFSKDKIYRVDLDRLFMLMSDIINRHQIPITCSGTAIEDLSSKTISKYIGLLNAGNFISENADHFTATDNLQRLWDALLVRDISSAASYFMEIKSYSEFISDLNLRGSVVTSKNLPERERPSYTYIQIAEICGQAIKIDQEAVFKTDCVPTLSAFVDIAMSVYDSLVKDDQYVLAGLWLETMAKQHAMHPIVVRDKLSEAHSAGLIARFTQGSTPDTRFENHTLSVLDVRDGLPVIQKVLLYHGDFLIPGKASVSLRIERK